MKEKKPDLVRIQKLEVDNLFKAGIFSYGRFYKFILHFIENSSSCLLSSAQYHTLECCIEDMYEVINVCTDPWIKTKEVIKKEDLSEKRVIQWIIYEINIKYLAAMSEREVELGRALLPLPSQCRRSDLGISIARLQSRQTSGSRINREGYQIAFGHWKDLTFSFT